MHENSRLLFEKHAIPYFRSGLRVLEIGPSGHPSQYQRMTGHFKTDWETLDLQARPGLTHLATNEYSFPIADGAYDVVLSGQVIEHVRKIWVWMRELQRVCKPGGIVITINPVSWPYHEAPIDCWRVFPDGMKALYDDAGLEVLLSKCESIEGSRFRNVIPGRGLDWQPSRRRWLSTFLERFGYPVECSFDTITIGKRPEAAPQ